MTSQIFSTARQERASADCLEIPVSDLGKGGLTVYDRQLMTVADQSGSSLGKFSCLIVEDDGGFAAMAAKVVREQNGEPVIVGTLAAAQEVVGVQGFDVVLLDNHLPDGKGYDFFEHLTRRRSEEHTSELQSPCNLVC